MSESDRRGRSEWRTSPAAPARRPDREAPLAARGARTVPFPIALPPHPSSPSCRKLDNAFLGSVHPGQLTRNFSAVHDQDTIGHGEDLVNFGRDYNNTGALSREPPDEVMDLRFGPYIDAARGLIE